LDSFFFGVSTLSSRSDHHVQSPFYLKVLNVNVDRVALTPDSSSAGVSVIGSLSIAPSATLDIGANKLVTAIPTGTCRALEQKNLP
jgi:hypothetical protein